MIRIDKITFDFNVENEAFAYDLYAKWDEFCRECFENVVEEYLTGYDRKKMLIEIDLLDIDLGDIPEEDFYRQFPIRLREALQHQLNIAGIRQDQEVHLWEARLENLIYYLENGFCRIEWADPDFNVAEEVDLLMNHLPQSMPGLVQSCFNKGYMFERLMMQTDDKAFVELIEYWNEDKSTSPTDKLLSMIRLATARPDLIARMLVRLYSQHAVFSATLSLLESALQFDPSITSAVRIQLQLRIMGYLPERLRHHLLDEWKESMLWLSSPAISLHEKRRYLGMILDIHPDIPVHFIHETEEESNLDRMAEILDAVVVKQIMITECEPHAEVDVPVYWHNLYNWLIEYYPFNGLAVFGDKRHFRMHLNQRLLTFIRKRNYAAYLSKEELTLKFLLEVFGHEYYQNVVNAIFNLQPRNTDGTPVYTDTFNQEFYRMLLKLSILRQPSLPEYHRHEFTYRLMDTRISKEEKLSFLRKMVVEQPIAIQEWICIIGQNNGVVTLLAELTDIHFVHALLETVSPHTAETFRQLEKYIHTNISEITWLSGINEDKLSFFIRKSMFHWIGLYKGRIVKEQEYAVQFLQMLYLEVTGNGNGKAANTISTSGKKKIEGTVRKLSVQLHFADSFVHTNQESEQIKKQTVDRTATLPRWVNYISALLKNSSVSNYEKRRILARAEIVQQVIHYLLNEQIIKPDTVQDILAKYLTGNEKKKLQHISEKETIKQFIDTTGLTSEITNMTQNEFLLNIINNLNMNEMEENNFNELQNKPEFIEVSNAGLALLSPYYLRLFSLLDLLDNKKDFKDMNSRIRAIFILQYFVGLNKTEYTEQDLAFNRILVNCPFSEPLPKELKLNAKEIEVTDSLLNSLKINWSKMKNTSIEGIQKAFIERKGKLEKKEDFWILNVEERAYDILLDSVPWSFRLIHFPWLKENIKVKWRSIEDY